MSARVRARAAFAPLPIALALIASPALPSCSSETSIVLVIHATDLPSKDATQLEVHVGTGVAVPRGVPDELDARWWERAELAIDPAALTFPAGFGGRNYELLIRPSSGLATDAALIFAVVGYGPDEDPGDAMPAPIVAFRAAEDAVGFADGEIRRIDLPLVAHDPAMKLAGVTASGCVWWNAPQRDLPVERLHERAIVPADDLDCDDYRPVDMAADCDPRADCDEADPGINPGAMQGCDTTIDDDCCSRTQVDLTDDDQDGQPNCDDCADADPFAQSGNGETCDGIDTDCDGFDRSTTRVCGVPVADACRLGSQVCNETGNGRPSFGMCVAEAAAPDLPGRVCTLCNDPSGPVDCRDVRVRGGCGVHTSPEGSNTACLDPLQQVTLPPCPVAQCTWIIDGVLNQNGWGVSLVDVNDAMPGASPAPSFTGANAALRVINAGPLRQAFLIRRMAGPQVTLDVVGLERSPNLQCAPVQCTLGN